MHATSFGISSRLTVLGWLNEQINVAAFAARYDIPIGSQALPEGTRWVEEVPRSELENEYDGWGPDVAALLRCMPEKVNKWAIHVVYPPLEEYARGRVALIGDAVSHFGSTRCLNVVCQRGTDH